MLVHAIGGGCRLLGPRHARSMDERLFLCPDAFATRVGNQQLAVRECQVSLWVCSLSMLGVPRCSLNPGPVLLLWTLRQLFWPT